MKVTLALFLVAAIAMTYAAPFEGEDETYAAIDRAKLIVKYAHLIEKYGEKAWHFLECMGIDWAEHCVAPTITCVAAKDVEGCIKLIICEGKDAVSCVHNLK